MTPVFELKTSRLDALTLRINHNDWHAAHALLHKNTAQYQMFQNTPMVLDVSALTLSELPEVKNFLIKLWQKGFKIIALRHDNQDWLNEAAAFKLLFLGNKTPKTQIIDSQPKISIKPDSITISHITLPENSPNIHESTISITETARRTVVVNTPVRTGQQVYAEDADLIVLGMVSEGAEVIADGHIHIYAPMRGRALAGEKGDKTARIFIQSMQAELVSIAGIYRVFEQNLPPHLHKQAVQIELVEDRLAVAAINVQ